jgi:hypothetical protein
MTEDLYSALDPGIRDAVRLLADAGIETFESCQGGRATHTPSLPCDSTASAARALRLWQ